MATKAKNKQVRLTLSAATGQIVTAMRSMQESEQRALQQMTRDLQQTAGGWTNLKSTIVTVNSAIGLMQRAYSGVQRAAAIVNDLIAASAQQRTSIMQMNAALRNQGSAWGDINDELAEFAEQIQRTTRYGDEVTREVLTRFATAATGIRMTYDELISGAQLVIDIMERTGRSADESSRIVAAAMAGNTEMLGELMRGMQMEFRALARETNNTRALSEAAMRTLHETFDGAARRIDRIEQSMIEAGNTWSDAWEKAGDAISKGFVESGLLDLIIEKARSFGNYFVENEHNITQSINAITDALRATDWVISGIILGLQNTYDFFVKLEYYTTGYVRRGAEAFGEWTGQWYLYATGAEHAIARVTDAQREAWAERRRGEEQAHQEAMARLNEYNDAAAESQRLAVEASVAMARMRGLRPAEQFDWVEFDFDWSFLDEPERGGGRARPEAPSFAWSTQWEEAITTTQDLWAEFQENRLAVTEEYSKLLLDIEAETAETYAELWTAAFLKQAEEQERQARETERAQRKRTSTMIASFGAIVDGLGQMDIAEQAYAVGKSIENIARMWEAIGLGRPDSAIAHGFAAAQWGIRAGTSANIGGGGGAAGGGGAQPYAPDVFAAYGQETRGGPTIIVQMGVGDVYTLDESSQAAARFIDHAVKRGHLVLGDRM